MIGEPSHHRRAEIRPVKESVEDDLLTRPGVVGVDIGEKITAGEPTGQLGIIVYVRKKKKEEDLSPSEVVAKAVDDVKTDVQELVVELQPVMERVEAAIPAATDASITSSGGISMGPSRSVRLALPVVEQEGDYSFVGTLGAMVVDRSSGTPMALTNFHVACVDDSWSVGDRMVQPGIPDGGDPATQEFGSLTRASLTENVDGAVITVDDGRTWLPMVEGIGVRTLRRQIRIDTDTSQSARFSAQGDSGSVVMDMDMDRSVVGLLFGGSTDGSTTFANPIFVVLDELDATLAVRDRIDTAGA